MGKQEKRDKAEKKAKKKAKQIVEEAVNAAVTKAEAKATEGDDLAQQVKELRDGGMAWWIIGQELGLQPDKASNAAQGKPGAAKARTLYKKASGGTLPPTARAGKGARQNRLERALGDGPRPRGRRGRDALFIEEGATSMFTEEHSDEDVANMLRGKRITFMNSIAGTPETLRVHGKTKVEVVHYPSGRAVQFRQSFEDDHHCDPKFRFLPAHMRTILIDRIVKVAA